MNKQLHALAGWLFNKSLKEESRRTAALIRLASFNSDDLANFILDKYFIQEEDKDERERIFSEVKKILGIFALSISEESGESDSARQIFEKKLDSFSSKNNLNKDELTSLMEDFSKNPEKYKSQKYNNRGAQGFGGKNQSRNDYGDENKEYDNLYSKEGIPLYQQKDIDGSPNFFYLSPFESGKSTPMSFDLFLRKWQTIFPLITKRGQYPNSVNQFLLARTFWNEYLPVWQKSPYWFSFMRTLRDHYSILDLDQLESSLAEFFGRQVEIYSNKMSEDNIYSEQLNPGYVEEEFLSPEEEEYQYYEEEYRDQERNVAQNRNDIVDALKNARKQREEQKSLGVDDFDPDEEVFKNIKGLILKEFDYEYYIDDGYFSSKLYDQRSIISTGIKKEFLRILSKYKDDPDIIAALESSNKFWAEDEGVYSQFEKPCLFLEFNLHKVYPPELYEFSKKVFNVIDRLLSFYDKDSENKRYLYKIKKNPYFKSYIMNPDIIKHLKNKNGLSDFRKNNPKEFFDSKSFEKEEYTEDELFGSAINILNSKINLNEAKIKRGDLNIPVILFSIKELWPKILKSNISDLDKSNYFNKLIEEIAFYKPHLFITMNAPGEKAKRTRDLIIRGISEQIDGILDDARDGIFDEKHIEGFYSKRLIPEYLNKNSRQTAFDLFPEKKAEFETLYSERDGVNSSIHAESDLQGDYTGVVSLSDSDEGGLSRLTNGGISKSGPRIKRKRYKSQESIYFENKQKENVSKNSAKLNNIIFSYKKNPGKLKEHIMKFFGEELRNYGDEESQVLKHYPNLKNGFKLSSLVNLFSLEETFENMDFDSKNLPLVFQLFQNMINLELIEDELITVGDLLIKSREG